MEPLLVSFYCLQLQRFILQVLYANPPIHLQGFIQKIYPLGGSLAKDESVVV